MNRRIRESQREIVDRLENSQGFDTALLHLQAEAHGPII